MTIYYHLTFMLLTSEMVTFCLLVAPLPYAVRKRVFGFLTTSALVAKIAYALKISFIFVAILFFDALQRMFRISAEVQMAKENQQTMPDIRVETNIAARKFYAQRNTYLTGFCLFLSLVLTRTFYIMLDLVRTQEEFAALKKQATPVKAPNGTPTKDQSAEIKDLKAKLAALQAKERDFETLKKQAAQQAAEFDRLATKYNEATGSVSNKRKD